jgi:hypothetical protein
MTKMKNRDNVEMKLEQLPSAKHPFEIIGMETMQLPTSSDGSKGILTILYHFSRYFIMVPMKSQTAEEVTKAFVGHFILKYGVPHRLFTDCGTQFLSELMNGMCKLLKINKLHTIPHHPAGYGRTEEFHATIKNMLAHYVNPRHNNWTQYLPILYHDTIPSESIPVQTQPPMKLY